MVKLKEKFYHSKLEGEPSAILDDGACGLPQPSHDAVLRKDACSMVLSESDGWLEYLPDEESIHLRHFYPQMRSLKSVNWTYNTMLSSTAPKWS